MRILGKHQRHWRMAEMRAVHLTANKSSIKGIQIFKRFPSQRTHDNDAHLFLHSTWTWTWDPYGREFERRIQNIKDKRAETNVELQSWFFISLWWRDSLGAFFFCYILNALYKDIDILTRGISGQTITDNGRIKESMRRDYQFIIVWMHQSFVMGCHLPLVSYPQWSLHASNGV